MPPKMQYRTRKGSDGICRIEVSKKKKLLKIDLKTGGTIKIQGKNASPWKNLPDGLYRVSTTPPPDPEIYTLAPLNAEFSAKFTGFSKKADQDEPRPLALPSQYKEGEFYYVYTPIFEAMDGPYKGCSVALRLVYKFEKAPDKTTYIAAQMGSPAQRRNSEFLSAVGMEWAFPYQDNLLPWLEEQILEKNLTVTIRTDQNGYCKEVIASDEAIWDDGADLPEEEGEELNWDEVEEVEE